jgi:glycosyltransferase involved in cell wall biosynthesis
MANNKDRRIKILWSSNGHHTNSGYGIQTRDILFRMRDDGWNIAESAFYGLDSYPCNIDGIKVYPKMADPFGADAMLMHGKNFNADVTFCMQDIWTLDPNILKQIKNWIPYFPIDKEPIPAQVLERCKYAYKLITFSKFGHDLMEKAGFYTTYIPEGTDTNIFKPLDKVTCRREINLPENAFIFGVIGANKENPPRKGYQEMLEAFSLFEKKHPEAILFFHCQQIAPGNFPIMDYANYLGFGKKVYFMDQYVATCLSSSDKINKELNTFDICLHPSQTEGFGLVIVEAQSAGIPVIVNNCHSMPELVIEGKTGEICKTGKPRWTSDNSLVYPADVDSLYEKMELLYKKLHEKNTIAKDCRDNILTHYSIDDIFKDKWIPYLEELQKDILG